MLHADFETAMAKVAERNFSVKWQNFSPDKNFLALVESLACEKFSQESFNRKR